MRRVLEEIVFRLSMPAHSGQPKGDLSHRPATFSADKYDEWRTESLRDQFEAFFDWNLIKNKRVLDLGCGTGPLSLLCAQHGAASVIGVDLSSKSIERARAIAPNQENLTFVLEESTQSISAPDRSVDVIVCFDVLEHVMDYEAIVREWKRILAPGGRILIWWSVWWHPYGHHMHTMIPLPWVHVFLRDESLFRICARIYDTPQFKPRIWHFDDNGNRKPNPYQGRVVFDDLNKLTIQRFDRLVTQSGLSIERKQVDPFTGSSFAALKRLLARALPDFFCSCVVYQIQQPQSR